MSEQVLRASAALLVEKRGLEATCVRDKTDCLKANGRGGGEGGGK